jgi:hypothetical protein
MAVPQPATYLPAARDGLAPAEAPRVYELFRSHLRQFACLPGENSHFDQSDHGHEWRCEFELGICRPMPAVGDWSQAHSLQLNFCLVDMVGNERPAGVLYLMDCLAGRRCSNRLLYSMADLSATLDRINEQIGLWDGTVEMSLRANQFIEALAELKQALGARVSWG